MTSEKAMLNPRRFLPALGTGVLWAVCGVLLAGCGSELFTEPAPQNSPYPVRRTWAIVPLGNESGQPDVDPRLLTEHLARQIRQIEGLDVLPMTRTLQVMQMNAITAVDGEYEATQLIRLLEVDGLLVGSITGWDPYDPPKIGATIRLYARPLTEAQATDRSPSGLDYRRLITASTSFQLPGANVSGDPKFIAQVSDHFDAANGRVLNRLKSYSTGRVPIDSASGWRRYLISMDLYAEFVSHELIRRLFALEWDRLNPPSPPPKTPSAN